MSVPTLNRNRIGDVAVLLVLAGLALVYGIDAVRASRSILNLILVLPVTIAVLVLCVVQFMFDLAKLRTPAGADNARESRPMGSPTAEAADTAGAPTGREQSGPGSASGESFRDVLPVMLLFTAYVLSLNWLGFDVGTFGFMAAFLWLHGERRLAWLTGYSFAFASLAAWFFSMMLPYPMPMLLLATAY